jgi:hypothetical protein
MWREHLARTASLTKRRFSPCTTSHTPRTPCATTPSYNTGYSPFSSCCVTPWCRLTSISGRALRRQDWRSARRVATIPNPHPVSNRHATALTFVAAGAGPAWACCRTCPSRLACRGSCTLKAVRSHTTLSNFRCSPPHQHQGCSSCPDGGQRRCDNLGVASEEEEGRQEEFPGVCHASPPRPLRAPARVSCRAGELGEAQALQQGRGDGRPASSPAQLPRGYSPRSSSASLRHDAAIPTDVESCRLHTVCM